MKPHQRREHDDLRRLIGRRIAAARRQRGMSQLQLGIALGETRQRENVSDWECGRRAPLSTNLAMIAKVLRVSADYLLGGGGGDVQ